MKIKIKRIMIIMLVSLLASCAGVEVRDDRPGPAAKGTRELDDRIVGEGGERLDLYEDYHALVVGVGKYDFWPDLDGPERDAEEVAGALKDLGMKVTMMKSPTSEELKAALNNLAYQKGQKKNRAILFFFSGHGETESLITGEKLGYIAPRDCPMLEVDRNGFNAKAISMKLIETYALKIRSKHVLMVFDSCFSGSIFPALKGVPAVIADKINNPVRQFITAGAENESVPDDGLFKSYFIKGIRGEADLIRDGYITGSELGLYLQDKVIAGSRGLQHPRIGRIMHPTLTGGDFIFTAVAPASPASAPAAPAPDVSTAPEATYRPDAAPAPVIEKTGYGWLTITSEPPGASVFADGEHLGNTPLIRKRVSSGVRTIT
ncbi:MAG: PEGA domain-containing protein, partial [Desulfobacterales bacterium]|nr:PEGA domain-containing protein [Desulfobacterales bacterium]